VRDAVALAAVETGKPGAKALADLGLFIKTWVEPRFPVTGADLTRIGMTQGPEMGRALAELEAWWVASNFAPDREACLARLREP